MNRQPGRVSFKMPCLPGEHTFMVFPESAKEFLNPLYEEKDRLISLSVKPAKGREAICIVYVVPLHSRNIGGTERIAVVDVNGRPFKILVEHPRPLNGVPQDGEKDCLGLWLQEVDDSGPSEEDL